MMTDLFGDSVPKPLGFSAFGNQKGHAKRQGSKALPLRHPRLGARVVPQRCLILRAGKIIISLGFHGLKEGEQMRQKS